MDTPLETSTDSCYHDGMRSLQDRFDSRRLADRLDERLGRGAFTDEDRAFIQSRPMFFLATADAQGQPDCSYKGGAAGIRPDHRRRRAGVPELRRQRHVPQPRQPAGQPGRRAALHRFRVAAAAAGQRIARRSSTTIRCRREFPGAQLVVRVRASRIFPNCPRYIHRTARRRTVALRATRGLHAAGAEVEIDGDVRRRAAGWLRP